MQECSTPIKFALHTPCTVQDIIHAQSKLVGSFQVNQVCNFHGVEVPLSHVVELGQLICIRCQGFMDEISPMSQLRSVAEVEAQPVPVHDMSACRVALSVSKPVDVSPTVEWSQPVQDVFQVQSAVPCGPGSASVTGQSDNSSISLLAAAPLLALHADQFLKLQTPVVRTLDHLQALQFQLLASADRHAILLNQQGVWADDELRFHLGNLRLSYFKYQQGCSGSSPKQCFVIDPLLFTGWVHHGFDEDAEWCGSFSDVKSKESPVITCCSIEGHWIPLIMTPVAGNLHVTTWDDPSRNHSMLQAPIEAIGKALGFSQIAFIRHHRLFFSSDRCGAMAVAFLHHSLLDTMLPTNHDEVVIIHDRLRNEFAEAVQMNKCTHRPWVWGTGEVNPTTPGPAGSAPLNQAATTALSSTSVDAMSGSFSHQCISKEIRLDLMREHERQWGDDEIRFHLLRLLREHERSPSPNANERGFVMMDPLLLSTWDMIGKGMCETWCRANRGAIQQGLHIVAIFFLNDHWFPVWFNYHRDTIVAHRIADEVVSSDTIMPVLNLLKEELGFHAAVEHVMPNALEPHQLCGAAAIAFVSHLVTGTQLPRTFRQLEHFHVAKKAEFVEALYQGTCCICPVAWGSGPFSLLVQSLSEELVKHGVPLAKAETRAQQAIKAIGSDNVASALKAKNPWRSLKAQGSNVRFQFILPEELEAVIHTNKNQPVDKKQKSVPLKPKPAAPDMIDPAKLALLEGTFRCQGTPVPQLAVQQIGPVACGVALITLEEAAPYLRAGKRVSTEPLALAVFGPVSSELVMQLPHATVMIPCMCVANSEPLLVEATLVQLGQGFIEKHVASAAVELDNLDVVSLKMMVYRDEFSGQWEDFVSAPIKHLVLLLPILRKCMTENCQCDSWHNHEKLAVKDPIMDVWRRQFLSGAFKPTKSEKAEIFSVCLRVPAVLLKLILPLSGQSGVYIEPRTPDGKEILPEYAVIWTPRMNASEMAHLRQTNPAIIGFARIGERKGFRVLAAQAKSMHELVRPETAFLPSGPKNHHVAGPFPWGSDRQAIAKAMKQVGWQVKALQPMQPIPGRGSMWLLQAVDDPPEAIILTSHGEVVITKHREQNSQAKQPAPSTVGSVSTLSLCGSNSGPPAGDTDPWLSSDPWGPYNRQRGFQAGSTASDGLQQLEARLQTAILAKIPTAMEQDDIPERMSTLEGQVQLLMSKNQSLETQMNDFSASSNKQFAVVQQQIQQQSQSFHGQLETHAQGIQAMFTQQMEQIRGLLSKRPRDDTME